MNLPIPRITKAWELCYYLLDQGHYRAYCKPGNDATHPANARRFCYIIDWYENERARNPAASPIDKAAVKALRSAISDALAEHLYLHDLMDKPANNLMVYSQHPAFRRRALAFWRRLAAKLRKEGV